MAKPIRCPQARLVLAAGLVLGSGLAAPALAINWEGHDEWFHDAAPFKSLTDLVAPLPPKRLPPCEERRKAAAANPYEQIALPGVNCTDPPEN
ncbi:MAG: hypothetical protein R3D33_15580 [Hyphomicrobiaceae bacterium]